MSGEVISGNKIIVDWDDVSNDISWTKADSDLELDVKNAEPNEKEV